MSNIVKPDVRLLAYTQPIILKEMEVTRYASQIKEYSMEFAGRACYQSFDRPNPDTADTGDYLRNIIKLGHESVLEHASATFYLTGVSRSFTHELIRHRHLSFSQLSQRYVDESEANIVVPPAMRDLGNMFKLGRGEQLVSAEEGLEWIAERGYTNYEVFVEALLDAGLARKQAREAARAVLPNMTETRIVVTGNLRAWRDMLWKRCHPSADAEMRGVSIEILTQLMDLYPDVFGDIYESTESDNW